MGRQLVTGALGNREGREHARAPRAPARARPPGARLLSGPGFSRLLVRALGLMGALILLAYAPAGAAADEPPRAGLVIQFDDGRIETRCIAIEAEGSTGVDLLAQSGLDVIMDASSGMGITVCQVEDLGCPYPAKPCFCQCMSGSECAYWNYYYREPGQLDWTYSPLGAKLRQLQPGVVEAWVWGDGQAPPSDELTFEAICGSGARDSTVTPEAVGGQEPAAHTATPASQTPALHTPRPTAGPAPTETRAPAAATKLSQPAPSPAPSETDPAGPTISSYWPFGLMVLALVAVGAFVWRRRSGGA